MSKHLVLVGGGHAHLSALARLEEFTSAGHRVTVVSASSYQYYSGMGPGMLSGIYLPKDVRFHIEKMATDRGGVFREDKVIRIDPVARKLTLHGGGQMDFDVVSFNTGSEVPGIAGDDHEGSIVPVKPVVNLFHAREHLLGCEKTGKRRIVVVGGGPAGVEVAGNVHRLLQDAGIAADIRLYAGSRFLEGCPQRVARLALESFRKRDVTVREGIRAKCVDKGNLVLSNDERVAFDLMFVAIGVKPSSIFLDSRLPTGPDGGLLVDKYLRSVDHPEIFGGGDCISLSGQPLAKAGVYAVRQNPVLLHNLRAALEGRPLIPFDPGGRFLLIMNMGDGKGILWKGDWAWDGRIAFLLKDYIDRRFMRKFQLSGEREES